MEIELNDQQMHYKCAEGVESIESKVNAQENEEIQSLALEIAAMNDWCYPNLRHIDARFVVERMNRRVDAYLSIQVEPPVFEEEDVDGILINEDIVSAANDFHNNIGMHHTMDTYGVELSDSEIKMFLDKFT